MYSNESVENISRELVSSMVLARIRTVEDLHEQWLRFTHYHRYIETVLLCPQGPARVLDLGYSEIYSPVLSDLREYTISGIPVMSINFECDRYPFDDESLDGALCCEVIEHYTDDPLFSMIELNRIIRPGGFLVLTTPNVTSWEAIYKALRQDKHPSTFPLYAGGIGAHCIHAREYMVSEVVTLMEAAGFEVEKIYTANYDPQKVYEPIPGFPEENRGETIYCLARKVSKPRKRAVRWIYGNDIPWEG